MYKQVHTSSLRLATATRAGEDPGEKVTLSGTAGGGGRLKVFCLAGNFLTFVGIDVFSDPSLSASSFTL